MALGSLSIQMHRVGEGGASGGGNELQGFAYETDREAPKGHQDDPSALFGSQTRGQQAAQDNEKGDVVHLLCKVASIDSRRGISRSKKSLVEAVRPVDRRVGRREQNPSNPGGQQNQRKA